MQLETIRTQTNNQVRFVLFMNGEKVATFHTQAAAWDYQDKLWALYAGR